MIEVQLVDYTQNPEMLIASAAKTCIRNKSFNDIRGELTKSEIEKIIDTVISKNHLSVLEHINFIFSISGVSRVFTHQLVRHRIASYSQLSQQRSDSSELDFIIPPEIKKYNALAREYEEKVKNCQDLYRRLVRYGISKGSARYVLPSSFCTSILATFNARSLFNLLAQRECRSEEWEFREVACLMHTTLMKVAPSIFKHAGPPCQTQGLCPEGRTVIECGGYLGLNYSSQQNVKVVALEKIQQ
jgi:thymidylate synthase (FAD)